MSCAQVSPVNTANTNINSMSTAGLVAMRSSCPRNPSSSTTQSSATKARKSNDGYGAEVLKPGPHDVLLGRGGGTNNHPGNINFRKLVNEHKMRYLSCSKIEKPTVAREVVELWRKLDPPGRFLARKEDTVDKDKDKTNKRNREDLPAEDGAVVWIEVPEKKAREKASQCLRERTPDVVPYIRQLREQQDQMTEKGFTMIQQQLKMQRDAESQQSSLHGMAVAAANYSRRNSSLAENAMYQNNMNMNNHQQHPMAAMSSTSAHELTLAAHRRGSMPAVCSNSGLSHTIHGEQPHHHHHHFDRRLSAPHLMSGGGGSDHVTPQTASSMMGMPQQSCPHSGAGMMEPGMVGSSGASMYDPYNASSRTAMQLQQQHQQMQMQQMQLQQQQQQLQMQMQQQQMQVMGHMHPQQGMHGMNTAANGGMHHSHSSNHSGMQQQMHSNPSVYSCGHAAAATNNNWNMQSMNGMAADHHGLDPSSNSMMGSHHTNSSHSHSHHSQHSGGNVPDAAKSGGSVVGPEGADSPLTLPGDPHHHSDHHNPASARTSPVPPGQQQGPRKSTKEIMKEIATHDRIPKQLKQASKKASAQPKGALKTPKEESPPPPATTTAAAEPKTTPKASATNSAPAVTPEDDDGQNLFAIEAPGTGGGGDDDAHGELTLEEYRKTLESYMASNNITAPNPSYYSDDDLSVESFPAWPDDVDQREERPEHGGSRRFSKQRGGRAEPKERGVNHTKSNQSMMSCKTFKSDSSHLSGFSMLSDMMSMASLEREQKLHSTRRYSSNASIMSELSDISHTIDGLGLDD